MTTTSKNAEMLEHPIVFYDGVCVLCNRFVDKVINADTRGIFRFAPLQGDTARAVLPPLPDDPREWSVVYFDADGMRTASDGLRGAGAGVCHAACETWCIGLSHDIDTVPSVSVTPVGC